MKQRTSRLWMQSIMVWLSDVQSPALPLCLLVCLSAVVLDFANPWWGLFLLLGLASFLFLAAFFPSWRLYLPIMTSGHREARSVALTFDDGPDPVLTPLVLKTLAAHDVKATFFVIGRKASKHPELIHAITAAGHEIGNHTWSHDCFWSLRRADTVKHEVAACQEMLRTLGVECRYFRPPLGITNPRVRLALQGSPLHCVCFSRRPVDFGNRRVRRFALRLLARVREGDIVLLHDCRPSSSFAVESWIEQLEQFIDGVKKRGKAIIPHAQCGKAISFDPYWGSLHSTEDLRRPRSRYFPAFGNSPDNWWRRWFAR